MLTPELQKQINNAFTYHAPHSDQAKKYEAIRGEAKILATLIAELCPDSTELLISLQYLQTATMWANASISMHG